MSILRKVKSLLGLDDAETGQDRDVTVTVEHDPAEATDPEEEADPENEAAVKGAEVEDSSTGGNEPDAREDEGVSEEERTDEDVPEADATEEGVTAESPDEVEIPDAEEPDATESDDAEAGSGEETEAVEGAAADEGGASDDAGDGAAGEPVDVLNGIGPAYAQRLGDAGIDSVGELAAADAAELSDATEIAEGRVQNWIDQAAEY